MAARRIAFYAPLKAPSHPIPSGDRHMARLLLRAWKAAGATVEVASDFRAYDGRGEPAAQEVLRQQGLSLADDLIAHYRALPAAARPNAWFTYHLYHKAPDWLGPRVAQALEIPYLVAEASFAPKQAGGPWDLGHRAAAEAIGQAAWVFCLTRLDMNCVRPLVPSGHHLAYLPPFLDPTPYLAAQGDRAALAQRTGLDPDRRWLLAVAMMRPGVKVDSYRRLASALACLNRDDWQLLVVGDGDGRAEVEAALAPLGEKVKFAGAVAGDALPDIYAGCDLYLWPGVGEAYGMAYLEAQAAGLAVVAGNERGVPDVVCDGETGILTAPGDDRAFAQAVSRLLDDDALRQELADQAQAFAGRERSIETAASALAAALP